MVILKLLDRKDSKTGAELADEIGRKSGSKPSYGSVYPLLKDLEEKRLVKKEEKGREKRYSLTREGKNTEQEFKEKKEELEDSVLHVLKTFRTIFDDDEVNTLIRSFEQKKEQEAPRFPELLQIHELLLKFTPGEKIEEIGEILAQTRKDLRGLWEESR